MMSSLSASKPDEEGPKTRRQERPAAPSPAAVSSIERDHQRRAAVVERVGEVDLGPGPLEAVALEPEREQAPASRRPSGGSPSSRRGSGPAASARCCGRRRRSSRRPRSRSPGPRPAPGSRRRRGRSARRRRRSRVTHGRGTGARRATAAARSCRRPGRGPPRPARWRRRRSGSAGGRRPRRLRLEGDDAQLALGEVAALLDRGQQPLVVEVAVAEVVAEDDAGDSSPSRTSYSSMSSTARALSPLRARPWECIERNARPL